MLKEMTIREERPDDVQAVQEVIVKAFDKSPETPVLVELLRARNKIVLSYVAEIDGRIVGNVMFVPGTLKTEEGEEGEEEVLILAPLGVVPECQSKGVGTQLTQEALAVLRQRGHQLVFLVGHPEYYPRFGFQPAGPLGIRDRDHGVCPAFMVLELRKGALDNMTGELINPPEFKESGA